MKASPLRVEVSPKILNWALQCADKDETSVLKKFPKFNEWKNGTVNPTVKQLEEFGRFTGIPFGYLLLKDTPKHYYDSDIADFRTLGSHGIAEKSKNLLDTIEIMRGRQDWLREYKISQEYDKIELIGSIDRNMPEAQIADKIKKDIQLDSNWRDEVGKEEAFRFVLNKVENAGVVVFVNGVVDFNTSRKLDLKEFRGFALVDEYAPLIFINGNDAAAGKMFTLIHELVHLYLGQDGLDDGTEAFCNKIAAMVLVPGDLFQEQWELKKGDYKALSDYFKVSLLVIYRVALTRHLIGKNQYDELVAEYYRNFDKSIKSSGGNFYKAAKYKLGKKFCRYVLEALRSHELLYRDAYQMLGIKSGRVFNEIMKVAEE